MICSSRFTRLRHWMASALVVVVFAACASVDTRRRIDPGLGAQAGVSFALYADDDGRRAGVLGPSGVVAVLEHYQDGGYLPIFRGLRSEWAVTGLEPGRYRLVVGSQLDPLGHEIPLPQPTQQRFRVRAGEMVELEANLHHVSKGWIAAGVVAAVVAAVVLADWLDDKGLPTPPLPPPPPLWLADLAFSVVVDLSVGSRDLDLVADAPPPLIPAALLPAPDTVVPAGPIQIVLALSIDPGSVILAPEAWVVRDGDGEVIAGELRWESRRWSLVWESVDDLESGTLVEVQIAPEVLRGRGGRQLPGALETHFEIE